jgi:hypothetical protein
MYCHFISFSGTFLNMAPKARFGDDEYALAQSSDPVYSGEQNHTMLFEELRNLHYAEAMRTEFESLVTNLQLVPRVLVF